MDQAIGRRVDDYLVKPINPNQVLSVLKRLLEGSQIRHQTIAQEFSRRYLELEEERKNRQTWEDWVELYRELLAWEMRLIEAGERGLLQSQREIMKAANADFVRYVRESYRGWVAAEPEGRPTLSPDLVERFVRPLLEADEHVLIGLDRTLLAGGCSRRGCSDEHDDDHRPHVRTSGRS